MIIDTITSEFNNQNALIAGFIAEGSDLLENQFSMIVCNQIPHLLTDEHLSEGTAQLLRNFESARVESIEYNIDYSFTDKFKFSIGFEIGGQRVLLGVTPHQDAELSSGSFDEPISIPTVSHGNNHIFKAFTVDLEDFFDKYGPNAVIANELKNPNLMDINPVKAVARGLVNYDLSILAELLLSSKSETKRFVTACNKLDEELLNSRQMIRAVSKMLVDKYGNDFKFISDDKSMNYAHSIAVSVFNDVSEIEQDFAIAVLDGLQGMGAFREMRYLESIEKGDLTNTFYWPHITHAQLCELDNIDLRIKEQMINYKLSDILVSTLENTTIENPKLADQGSAISYEQNTFSL